MKKIFFAFLAMIISSWYCQAQHEYDIWYFGSNAGLDFNSGSPVSLTNGQIYTTEGSASISDYAGNLLFYTDGVTVWNKNHQQMVNGFGLFGGGSTTQSALILRKPGSDSLYYIFTVGQAGSYGLTYSVVNMSLQSGLGEVILKNSALLSTIAEKITTVPHSNGIDYWVIVHDLGNKDFYAYLLSASGVNASGIISTVGKVHNWEIGGMKASHDGKKLAVAVQYDDFFQLLDFDNTNGTVSNPITILSPPTAFGPYGVEFAPNDSVLYGTAYSQPCVILQWDISSNDSATINTSRIALDSSSASNIGTLQLGSDGRIYMAKYGETYLGVVNNPNVYGTGCNYFDNGFNLSPKSNQLGLPNIPPFWFNVSGNPSASFASSDSGFCALTCINFNDQSSNNSTSWEWQFPGGNPSSSTDENPTNICYPNPGSYDVTLIVTNAIGNDTTVMTNFVTVFSLPAPVVTQSNDTLYASPGSSYQWYYNGNAIAGATNSFYVPSTEDFYSVTISDVNGCSGSVIIFFSLAPQSNFSAPNTLICQKFCLDFFDQSGNSPTSWQWEFPGASPSSSTAQNPSQICYNAPGTYDVTLITGNTYGGDTLTLPGYVTVFATPAFPTITQTGYTLTTSPSYSYQWQLNSNDIAGATNQSYTVLQTGFYTIIVGDSNACKNSATVYVVISSVQNPDEDNDDIFIWPNPSNGSFTIEGLNGSDGDKISVAVVNTLGQIIFSAGVPFLNASGKMEINLRRDAIFCISTGIYFIEIKTKNDFVRKKIIITK